MGPLLRDKGLEKGEDVAQPPTTTTTSQARNDAILTNHVSQSRCGWPTTDGPWLNPQAATTGAIGLDPDTAAILCWRPRLTRLTFLLHKSSGFSKSKPITATTLREKCEGH